MHSASMHNSWEGAQKPRQATNVSEAERMKNFDNANDDDDGYFG